MALPTVDNVSRPKAMGYGVRINKNYYRLLVTPETPMQRENAELAAPKIDQAANPEDVSQSFGVIFSRADFSGGEGLRLAHLPTNPESAPSMFWDSLGIETNASDTAQRSKLELLNDVDKIFNTSASNIYLAHDRPSERLYFSDGTNVKFTDNPFSSMPTISTEDPHDGDAAQNIRGLAYFDGMLYVALGSSGLHRRTGVAAYTEIDSDPATNVWNVKGRIIWASNNLLKELTDVSMGTSTTRITVESGFTFLDAVDIGSEILVTATDGYVYSLTLDEETSELNVAGRFNVSGEIPSAITSLDGIVLLSTYQLTPNGGYVARLWLVGVENGNLQNRQLIKEFGDSTTDHDYRIHAASTKRNSAFIGVSETDKTHLWRYDFATAGLSRNMGEDDYVDAILSVTHISSRTFWSVEGEGIFRQSSNRVTTGYLITPLASNFTRDRKSWSGLVADVENVAGGTKVELWYSTDEDAIYDPDHPSWIKGKDIQSIAAGRSRSQLRNAESRYITIKIVLHGGIASSPVLNSFTVDAYPGGADIMYNLPINISDLITRPNHSPKKVKGLGRRIESTLRAIQGSSVEVEVLDPQETILGTVLNVSQPVIYYPRTGSSPLFVAQVQVRGRRSPVVSSPSQSPAALGVGLLGVVKLGGIE